MGKNEWTKAADHERAARETRQYCMFAHAYSNRAIACVVSQTINLYTLTFLVFSTCSLSVEVSRDRVLGFKRKKKLSLILLLNVRWLFSFLLCTFWWSRSRKFYTALCGGFIKTTSTIQPTFCAVISEIL